ncbi:MAG TPA: DinB family protein [Vicinamibacterales bacterium]|nr:DinB family protein [Vicinamibacterales bacterium]
MRREIVTTMMMVMMIAGLGSALRAQTPGVTNPVSASVRAVWDGAKRNLSQSAEIMAEGDYGFRPVTTVRTFGEILTHVAGANYVFCSAARGEKAPFAEDAFEKTATTRAQIIKAVNDSIAYCDAAYAALDDKRAGESVELPFGMGKGARTQALIMNAGHVQEHYGNLVTYFRIKGIVPPSSRQQR